MGRATRSADCTRWPAMGLILVLLGFGGWRLTTDALRRPIVGYGDNYDMIRLMDVYGLWPVDGIRGVNHPQGPRRGLAFARFDGSNGVFSSQMLLHAPSLLPMAIVDWIRPGTTFDIRTIGFGQAMLILLLGASYCWRFFRLGYRRAAVLNGLVVAVLAGDPVNTLLLNGFYCELAAACFFYCALLEGLLMILAGPSLRQAMLVGLALFLLSTSKAQHWPTAVLLAGELVIAAWIAARRYPHGLTLAACLGAGVGAVLGLRSMNSGQQASLVRCNLTNSILAGILPLAKDPQRSAQLLKLPPQCLPYLGMNAYDRRMANGHPCPEISRVKRARLLRVFWDDPGLPWRMAAKALDNLEHQSRGVLVGKHIGQVEGEQFAQTPAWSISDLVTPLKGAKRRAFWLVPLAISGFYALRGVFRFHRRRRPGIGVPVVICGLLAYPMLFLVIVGDGYEDYLRHNHLPVNLLLAAYLLAAAHFVAWLACAAWRVVAARRFPLQAAPPDGDQPPECGPLPAGGGRGWWAAGLAIAAVLALATASTLWLSEPFAFSHWKGPGVDRVAEGTGLIEMTLLKPYGVEIRGWVRGAVRQSRADRVILAQGGRVLPVPVFLNAPDAAIPLQPGVAPSTPWEWTTSIPTRLVDLHAPVEAFLLLEDGTSLRLPAAPGGASIRRG